MAAFFFDSSALVKRYIQETGTTWVRNLTRRGASGMIYLAHITEVEGTAAVARRRQGGSLSLIRSAAILTRFRKHLAGRYLVLEITPALFADAVRLANIHALRAYDAVQLAAALELNSRWVAAGLGSITLVSADRELNTAATVEGLQIEDPNLHP